MADNMEMVRLNLIWMMAILDRKRREADAEDDLAGRERCFPRFSPLMEGIDEDLSEEAWEREAADLLLAATEAHALGHIDKKGDMVRITEAGKAYIAPLVPRIAAYNKMQAGAAIHA